MVRLSKSIYQMSITMIVNSSQSLRSIAVTGAILFLAELKKCVAKKGVYNAAVGGKFFHLCKNSSLQTFVGPKRCLGDSRGGGVCVCHKENARGGGGS